MRCGGWKSAQMSAKINGRWTYFYKPENIKPLNAKEPINFTAPYIPPKPRIYSKAGINQNLTFLNTFGRNEYIHPIRRNFLRTHLKSKAPLSHLHKNSKTPPALTNANYYYILDKNKPTRLKRKGVNYSIHGKSISGDSKMNDMNDPNGEFADLDNYDISGENTDENLKNNSNENNFAYVTNTNFDYDQNNNYNIPNYNNYDQSNEDNTMNATEYNAEYLNSESALSNAESQDSSVEYSDTISEYSVDRNNNFPDDNHSSNNSFSNELINGNEIADNEIVNNEIVNNEIVNNEIVDNDIANNEIVNDEIVNNEIVDNEIVDDEVGENES
ncbi:hypothetical protein TRFO_18411 [Tritrichomonas foetus]|uniref:Uncharacterized protein n=1 Tax=Tritrichomonas foetus TaxID=1144522 RepID=A0A1J4KKW5_9EUKA|nr:hypothetical protein TRFO_18411 [Tritrichomonas foetus]|eukprot:OHT11935.1 hypothetical protein TRFO_18411 [Tritrichomonas foetus]